MNTKELRPFVGVLFEINNQHTSLQNLEYFAPLSSPKNKHLKMKNKIDFVKIKNGELGAVNFNNMFPVTNENYKLVKLTQEKGLSSAESKYQYMLEY